MTQLGRKRLEFLFIAVIAILAGCYAPEPKLNAVLFGFAAGLSIGFAILWRPEQAAGGSAAAKRGEAE